MNKYFLSLMSILILFQSFKVADEIFSHKENSKRSYVIITDDQDVSENVDKVSTEETKKDVDINTLFETASLENGKKIAKQCSACHSFDNSMKIKVGPPLWNIVGRESASISDFKYSKALSDYKKAGPLRNSFIFLKIQKSISKVPK